MTSTVAAASAGPRILVFDFDGVLVDSNGLKRVAFFDLFAEDDRVSDDLVAEAVSKGTRYDTFRFIFETIGIPERDRAAYIGEYAARYDAMVQKGIARRGLFPGVSDALRELSHTHALYVNSATPCDALRVSIRTLSIHRLFRGLYGAPESKAANLAAIQEREGAEFSDMVFIGDGEGDRTAAEAAGCRFIGISNTQNGWRNTAFPLLESVAELPVHLGLHDPS